MRRTIRTHPGEVFLLTIGPLTNIALLFTADAEIPKLLKGLVMMCGVFTEHRTGGAKEWNAILDPHAAMIVYRAPVSLHRSIGLDVTMQVKMSVVEVLGSFTAPLLIPVCDFAKVWFARHEYLTFHDPLAAATIFDNDICRFERGNVVVDLDADLGYTHWQFADREGAHEVAVDVAVGQFFQHYFGVFAGK